MASCDPVSAEHNSFLQEYGEPGATVDGEMVDQAFSLWQEGEISADTLNAVQQNFNSGCTVPNSSGSSDSSEWRVTVESIESPAPGGIVVSWSAENVVVSGDGEELSDRASITLDGSEVESKRLTHRPGAVEAYETQITDAPAGDVEVCVELP